MLLQERKMSWAGKVASGVHLGSMANPTCAMPLAEQKGPSPGTGSWLDPPLCPPARGRLAQPSRWVSPVTGPEPAR